MAKIVNISTTREPRCKQLNGEAVFTYTQPVCIGPETYINASELRKGDVILDAELKPTSIESTVTTEGYYEVFTLTTDHPTHNFIAFNMICKNKMRAPEFEGPEM